MVLERIDEDYEDKLFNGNFYSNGVNMPAIQSAIKTGKKIGKKDYVGAGAEVITSLMPYGGAQLDKTIRGVADYIKGGKHKNDIYHSILIFLIVAYTKMESFPSVSPQNQLHTICRQNCIFLVCEGF